MSPSERFAQLRGVPGFTGFTIVEIVVTLVVISVLATIVGVLAFHAIGDARIANAQSDVNAIGKAILRLQNDLGQFPMFTSGAGTLQDKDANVVRLQGPGNLPSETSSSAWTAASPTDGDCVAAGCTSDTLENQLLTNTPGSTTNSYPTSARPGKPFQWKGPYLDTIDEDPWGKTYLVNIINAKGGSSNAAFVLSAGPDGVIETAFNIPRTSSLSASGDDILFRIR